MARFLKIFLVSFVVACIVMVIGVFAYFKLNDPLNNIINDNNSHHGRTDEDIDNDPNLTPFDKAVAKSKRINVLVMGLEHVRTDTIMLVSYDTESKKANIISIPRDTYYERKGYISAGAKKINAIYQSEGVDGLKKAVEDILKMPIHKYITVDYEAVIKGIDALGGVNYEVPFHMIYNDPYDTPPLHIDLPAGMQLLDGEKALKFLRFRKSYSGRGYPNGDIGRIQAQQDFVKAVIKKALSFKLPNFIKEVYSYVNTDLSISELIALGGNAVGFSMNDLETCVLPGVGKYIGATSFYIANYEEAINLTYKIYGLVDDTELE